MQVQECDDARTDDGLPDCGQSVGPSLEEHQDGVEKITNGTVVPVVPQPSNLDQVRTLTGEYNTTLGEECSQCTVLSSSDCPPSRRSSHRALARPTGARRKLVCSYCADESASSLDDSIYLIYPLVRLRALSPTHIHTLDQHAWTSIANCILT